MSAKEVVPGLYILSNNGINAYLLDEGDEGLTLIDSGFPKHAAALEQDIRSVGREPGDLTNILITHAHPDHLGSAVHLSGGTTPISLHQADAEVAAAGTIEPTMTAGPGFLTGILFKLFIPNKAAEFPSFVPDKMFQDGDMLDIAGGIEVVHTPGHTKGHVSLHWKKDAGLMLVGDAAANAAGLGYMLGYDDVPLGVKSAAKLAGRSFEAAVFGHGKPILSGASDKFTAKFH